MNRGGYCLECRAGSSPKQPRLRLWRIEEEEEEEEEEGKGSVYKVQQALSMGIGYVSDGRVASRRGEARRGKVGRRNEGGIVKDERRDGGRPERETAGWTDDNMDQEKQQTAFGKRTWSWERVWWWWWERTDLLLVVYLHCLVGTVESLRDRPPHAVRTLTSLVPR
ncbi:hypothetical protein LX36DRAFT_51176 [Colletotrichum falcatum]|nr:hypothetical protein LX36DRAFT_51176 [Colletotrichum falcatum]